MFTLHVISFICVGLLPPLVVSTTRTYYIGALELEWDFAPSGRNLVNNDDRTADTFLRRSLSPPMIGTRYKKALYREFTDATFERQVPHPPWLGVLGPVITAEVGDTIVVHFWNNCSRNYSVHPHGVLYTKLDEGALYEDGTTLRQKMDDGVPPGKVYTYRWDARPDYGPSADDPNCLTWAYHSHFMAENDINTGVVGVMVICKPGILDEKGKRTDVDKEYVLLFMVLNENLNYYLEDNIRTYLPGIDPSELKNNSDFEISNVKFGINGYIFGNLPGLDMCLGDKVSWHLLGLGSERDIHSVNFEGQTVIEYRHRKDVVNLFPAISTTVLMHANNPGVWLLSCKVDFHFLNGMQALFHVDPCGHHSDGSFVLSGKLRNYYIAAEEVFWDYAPSGKNKMTNKRLTKDKAARRFFVKKNRIGGEYKKAIFRGYTDSTFHTPLPHPPHLGILGPVVRAEVGDIIKVTFTNKASRPYSFQPYRLHLDKANEALMYRDGVNNSRTVVQPGQTVEYVYPVPSTVGPTSLDPQCLTGRYFSAVDPIRDSFSGLLGPLLLCKKGVLDDEGFQRDVDAEFFINFFVFDENMSHYFEENLRTFIDDPDSIDIEDEDFKESNLMHAVNGLMYGNLKGLVMCKDDVISWHIMGVGDDPDVHSVHFHGNTFSQRGMNKDTTWFIPETFETLLMKPDNTGEWALECRTNLHFVGGMRAKYLVKQCNTPKTQIPITGQVRTYFIAAIEDIWNFAPRDLEIIFGGKLSENENSAFFVNRNTTRIGRQYKKALFREFTDSSFNTMKKRGPRERHLSMLGPIIKAEVGDVIRVIFKNMATQNYSVHPHGVFYQKADEGSPYEDGTSEKKKLDDVVQPGGTYEYVWVVPERAGPGKNDFPCNSWAYYSAVDPVKDTNSGLIGPLITCRPGILNEKGERKDVDKEFVLLFSTIDENESWYLKENIEKFTLNPELVDVNDPAFEESNLKRAVNGRIFGNVFGLDMALGDHVAIYLLAMGSETDVHTVHLHGQTFLRRLTGANRHDVIELLPGTFQTIEMIASDPGEWLLHCHVNEHSEAGMAVTFLIKKPNLPTRRPFHPFAHSFPHYFFRPFWSVSVNQWQRFL